MLEEEEEEALVRWEPHLMGGFQRVFLAMVWNKLSSNSLNIGYFGVIWLFRITLSSLFFFFFFFLAEDGVPPQHSLHSCATAGSFLIFCNLLVARTSERRWKVLFLFCFCFFVFALSVLEVTSMAEVPTQIVRFGFCFCFFFFFSL